MASAAWTRKEGKSKSGGLNAKGRASYKKGKVKKVIKGLKKASKLHAGQAKVLKKVISKK